MGGTRNQEFEERWKGRRWWRNGEDVEQKRTLASTYPFLLPVLFRNPRNTFSPFSFSTSGLCKTGLFSSRNIVDPRRERKREREAEGQSCRVGESGEKVRRGREKETLQRGQTEEEEEREKRGKGRREEGRRKRENSLSGVSSAL